MAHTRWLVPVLVVFMVSNASLCLVAADPEEGVHRHIRTTDSRLRSLVQDGARSSPTLRALVDRLERSDVVVYLRCDMGLPNGSEGRLTFVSSAAGYRYLLVRIRWRPSSDHQIAIIAHELQHAVEIADAPAVVDAPSLAHEYRRIGFVNANATTPGIAFDSDAAILAGYRVLRELVGVATY